MRGDETAFRGLNGEVAVQVRRVFVTAPLHAIWSGGVLGVVVSAQVDAALGRYEGFLWWFG